MKPRGLFIVLLAGLWAVPDAMRAAPRTFRDTFDEESNGKPTTNYSRFAKWVVTRGTVDLIGKGGDKAVADFYPGNNLYVDLDGSRTDAGPGRLETKYPIPLEPGEYQFEFDLGGNSDGSAENSMTVTVGDFLKESFTRTNVTPPGEFERIVRKFTVTEPAAVKIVFDAEGESDYFGLIIDNVRLRPVPQGPSLSVVLGGATLAGLAGVGLAAVVRRRRGAVR